MRYETKRDVEVLLGLYQKLKEFYELYQDESYVEYAKSRQLTSNMKTLEDFFPEFNKGPGIGDRSSEISTCLNIMAAAESTLVNHFGRFH